MDLIKQIRSCMSLCSASADKTATDIDCIKSCLSECLSVIAPSLQAMSDSKRLPIILQKLDDTQTELSELSKKYSDLKNIAATSRSNFNQIFPLVSFLRDKYLGKLNLISNISYETFESLSEKLRSDSMSEYVSAISEIDSLFSRSFSDPILPNPKTLHNVNVSEYGG